VKACDVTCEPIPHPNDTFDYVMLNGVLEHWYCSPFYALSEIGRVLKPGGEFILETPNAANLRKRLWLLAGRYPYTPLTAIHHATHPHAFHHREHTMRELKWLVSQAGFEVVRALYRDGFHKSSPTFPKRLYWIVTALAPPFRDMLILVSRKPGRAAT
jgi:SAM-dependent methyltransferase